MSNPVTVVARPYTNRTPDDVRGDLRPGDRAWVYYPSTATNPQEVVAALDHNGGVYFDSVLPWKSEAREDDHQGFGFTQVGTKKLLADPRTQPIPRCLATDPRVGDTIDRSDYAFEVVRVTDEHVYAIDAEGYPCAARRTTWADNAKMWVSCLDRAGGARFDPHWGDRAITALGDSGRADCWVLARLGDTVKLNNGSIVSVQTWSSAADCLFPARYSRKGRVKT